jgi:hypothetical protein
VLVSTRGTTTPRERIDHRQAVERPRRSRALVAVLAAGAVPPVLINLFVLYGLNRNGTRLLDFLLHLIPLALGAWAATSWQETRPRAVAVLGVIAGAIEVLVMVAIFSSSGQQVLISLFGSYTVPALEDYLAVPATIALFTAGGLIVDRRKRKQQSGTTTRGHQAGETQSATEDAASLPSLLLHPATAAVVGFAGFALEVISTAASG